MIHSTTTHTPIIQNCHLKGKADPGIIAFAEEQIQKVTEKVNRVRKIHGLPAIETITVDERKQRILNYLNERESLRSYEDLKRTNKEWFKELIKRNNSEISKLEGRS